MKGITPIISIIVLLLITVSLAGAAYMFLGGYMTSYTSTVTANGACAAGTQAVITIANQGTNAITGLQPCTFADSFSAVCGDITITRMDGGGSTSGMTSPGSGTGEAFNVATIPAAQPGQISKATFTDTTCTSSGDAHVCRYSFTVLGQPAEVTVTCSG
jgi:flagellin-like protein